MQLQVKGGSLFDRSSKLQAVATAKLATDEPLRLDYAVGKLESQARDLQSYLVLDNNPTGRRTGTYLTKRLPACIAAHADQTTVALDHGMWDSSRPQVGYTLTLQLPSEEQDSCHWDKVDVLEVQELPQESAFTLRSGEAPPDEMLAFLRLINISGSDAFLMEAIFRNEAWGHMMVPVSPANEEAVCKSMESGCEQALTAYPTTLAEDIRAMDACTDPRQRLALRIRMDEKRVLESTADWFRQRMADLDSLEYYQERRLKRLGLIDDDGESTFEDMIQINM